MNSVFPVCLICSRQRYLWYLLYQSLYMVALFFSRPRRTSLSFVHFIWAFGRHLHLSWTSPPDEPCSIKTPRFTRPYKQATDVHGRFRSTWPGGADFDLLTLAHVVTCTSTLMAKGPNDRRTSTVHVHLIVLSLSLSSAVPNDCRSLLSLRL